MQALQQAFESTHSRRIRGPVKVWQGIPLRLDVQLSQTSSYQASDLYLGCFVFPEVPADAAVYDITCSFKITNTSGTPSVVAGCPRSCLAGLSLDWGSMLKLGQVSSWSAAEAKLRQLDLVHSDGCLHLQALVTNIV